MDGSGCADQFGARRSARRLGSVLCLSARSRVELATLRAAPVPVQSTVPVLGFQAGSRTRPREYSSPSAYGAFFLGEGDDVVILLPFTSLERLSGTPQRFQGKTIFGRSKRTLSRSAQRKDRAEVEEARSREEGCRLVSGTQSKLFVVVFLSSSRRGMTARRRRHDPRCFLAAGHPPPNVERQRWQDELQVEDASSLWHDASEPIDAAPVAQRTSQERSRRAENDPLSSHSSAIYK